MKPTIARLFQNASKSTVAANPMFFASYMSDGPESGLQSNVGAGKGKRGVMNKTESEFALMLDAQKRSGEILRYEFEGITLRWADMRYTPDFVVFVDGRLGFRGLKLIEVKGGHIWDRDIVRFKGARAYWPEFAFEMWQLKKGHGWNRKF